MARKAVPNKLRHRRQSGGFASFQWPSGKENYDECDEDTPNWLYDSYGRKKKPCKLKCPASCYKSKPKPYKPEPYKPYVTSEPYKPYTTLDPYNPYVISEPYVPDVPYVTGYDKETYKPEEPYKLAENVYGESAPYTPAPTEHTGGWIGETLATVCPNQCNPFNPALNKTTSCATTGKDDHHYCACRAGFRANAWNAKDFSKQFKIPGQPYVYTAEGVVCDTVCSDLGCSEVLERPLCM
ncbi:hypothetical protein GQ44DRAFT_822008 [Phaeosphaeriaceae sp. PMI808]|nr:hypothetical protein GQ44DRAFT_822008 [Phaeosphaeriaceae sp. PMI808]